MNWTDEQHKLCLHLWKSGVPAKDIARQVGRDRKAVYEHVRRLRASGFDLAKRPRGYGPGGSKWKPEARA